jgi:putative tryptophan/tyrosine transport system substrate-binding protein
MKRRKFIILTGCAVAFWPCAVQAQRPKMKRIAIVHPTEKPGNMTMDGRPSFRAFFRELSRLGFIEGQNLVVERYSGEGRADRYASLAGDIVNAHPDLIVSLHADFARAFKLATMTIPIVAVNSDPVALGLVPSLARPGGNITGVSVDAGLEIYGKRLELLTEATQKPSNARFLTVRKQWDGPTGAAVREAAQRTGISLAGALLSETISEADYLRVFDSMAQDRVDALIVSEVSENLTNRQLIAELAAKHRIPAIYPYREFVDVGGLMAYSVDLADTMRRLAGVVDKILKGANPADIPFYQPTKFELVINLKAAKKLGLTVPPTLLARADDTIE